MKFILFLLLPLGSLLALDNSLLLKQLDDVLNSFSGSVNISSAEIYNSQRAGYATGGSVSIRNNVYDTKIANITLPKIDAGCGGIDIYSGGISFVSSDQLVATLQNIAQAARGYAFLIGLEAVSPIAANNMVKLQSWANTINSIGINSCEHAQGLVGSILPRNEAYSQHICNSLSTTNHIYSDYISARHQCAVGKMDYNKFTSASSSTDVLLDYNVVWEAIKKHPSLAKDSFKANLIMSLTGTIIAQKNEKGERQVTVYPSRINDENFLYKLMHGGDIHVLSCQKDNENKCLVVRDAITKISVEDSWVKTIENKLRTIMHKAIHDEELLKEERDIILRSRLPIYRAICILAAKKGQHASIDLLHLSEHIAKDVLLSYLREVINLVKAGCEEVMAKQFFEGEFNEFIKKLEFIETKLMHHELISKTPSAVEVEFIRNINFLEEQMHLDLSLSD